MKRALVGLVNRILAEHYWPGQDPIGKRLPRGPAEAAPPWMTVVGEIGDVKQLAVDAPTGNQFYHPFQPADGRLRKACALLAC